MTTDRDQWLAQVKEDISSPTCPSVTRTITCGTIRAAAI
jgi:hypothetical protein